jgi:hypothetical protein
VLFRSAQSEPLEIAEYPLAVPVQGDEVLLDRRVDGLGEGRTLIFSGQDAQSGEQRSELATLLEAGLEDGLTKLRLTENLIHTYRRDTLTIYANVAHATHGETRQEVLGSGDASTAFQRFVLRESPITHISAPTPSGTESTLEVRVGDIKWHEVPDLYGHGPDERIFVTRMDEEGKTTVQFGDGRTGARLPTGQENVHATYRKGIGTDGLVGAEQLSLLLTAVLSVRGVRNPLAASGAEDPEPQDEARSNAPLTVLTLDRVVSLHDYEDFARAYAGIAKALATWIWTGETREVFVTVAGPGGRLVGDDLLGNLVLLCRPHQLIHQHGSASRCSTVVRGPRGRTGRCSRTGTAAPRPPQSRRRAARIPSSRGGIGGTSSASSGRSTLVSALFRGRGAGRSSSAARCSRTSPARSPRALARRSTSCHVVGSGPARWYVPKRSVSASGRRRSARWRTYVGVPMRSTRPPAGSPWRSRRSAPVR